ncbi:MAG: hypothetical protein ACRC8S_08215 [Fimbriiglobus sp.]
MKKIQIVDRLTELGRVRRRASVFAEFFFLITVSLVVLTGFIALDSWLRVAGSFRAVMLLSWLGLVAWLFGTRLRKAWTMSAKPISVAMLLEQRYPKLNDALATAVDLAERPDQGSKKFHNVTMLRAQNLSKRIPMQSVVPMGWMWKTLGLLLFSMMAILPVAAMSSKYTSRGILRFFDPLGNHEYPTKTQLTLAENLPTLLATGSPYPLAFRVTGLLPETAVLQIRLAGASVSEEVIPLVNTDNLPMIAVEHRIDGGRVPRSFTYRVLAGDAMSSWQAVEVAPPPTLVPIGDRPSPQIDLTFPRYTDLAPTMLPDGSAVVEAVNGTRFHFLAATDRRVVKAELVPQGDLKSVQTAATLAMLGDRNPLMALSAQITADVLPAPISLTISGGDGTRIEGFFAPAIAGLYSLQFTDERGLMGTRLLDFRLFADPAPAVVLERPVGGKDSFRLLPTAKVTIQALTEDRPYAVRDLRIEYRTNSETVCREIPLVNMVEYHSALPGLIGAAHGYPTPKLFTLDAQRILPVAEFLKPNGQAPGDGDTITLRVIASDWDDITPAKAPGRSREVELKVFSRSSLEAALLSDLANLRPDFLRLEEQLRDATARTTELQKKATEGKLTPDDAAKLAAAEDAQRSLNAKLTDTTEGLRAKVDGLQQTTQENQLKRSPTADKIDVISAELSRAVDQHLDSAANSLATAKAEAEKPTNPKTLPSELKKANQAQTNAQKSLDTILKKLEEWGGAGEIRGEARNLKDQVNRAAEQANKAASKMSPESPNAADKAALTQAADKMDALADRSADLLTKASRIADEKAAAAERANAAAEKAGSPEAAAALRDQAKQLQAEADALRNSVREAGGEDLPRDLRNAAADSREQRASAAEASQKSALDRLDKIADSLSEQPTDKPDELTKKQRANAEQMDRIASEQEELRKKTKALEAQPDSPERDAELKKLAGEQEKLRKKTEELLERLTREPQSEKTTENLRKAVEKMEASRDELEQGQASTKKQEEAVDKIDEALERLDRNKKDEKESLAREEREKIADKLKLLRDRQKAAVAEMKRIDQAAEKAKKWDRGLQKSLRDLGDVEMSLGEEVKKIADELEPKMPVFGKLLSQSAGGMSKAVKAIEERSNDIADLDPDQPLDSVAEGKASARVLKPMELGLRRLEQILASLADDPKKPEDNKKPEEKLDRPPMTNDGQDPKPQQGEQLPAMAQLKALRAMQTEVNELTAQFAKDHPDSTKLDDEAQAELRELAKTQQEITELFEKIAEAMKKQVEGIDE